jgi:hypothetical protein
VTTRLIQGGGRAGSSGFGMGAPTPGRQTVEHELVLLLAGTQSSREARSEEAVALLGQVEPLRLSALLDRLRVKVLLGRRLLTLGHDIDPWLENEITVATEIGRQRGLGHELVTLGLLAALEHAGIRTLPLKGSSLARELYGDAGARAAGDIDVLVAPEDLSQAIAVISEKGWRWNQRVSRAAEMPLLHEALTHPTLPRVELHWRVHWYERWFAADALARAEEPRPHQPLVMRPADGLAALILFYARDGFSGLRTAADVAAWWDSRCSGQDANVMLAEVIDSYPELAGPLRVGGQLLGSLVGLPTSRHGGPFRWRVAAELATPYYEPGPAQIRANTSLIDVLLAPPGGVADALRRERQKVPKELERPLTIGDGLGVHRARFDHLLRMSRRWLLGGLPAAARAVAGGTGPPPRRY